MPNASLQKSPWVGLAQKKNSYTHEKQGRRSYGCSECSCTHNKNVMGTKVYFCAQKIKTVVLQHFGNDFDGTQLERRGPGDPQTLHRPFSGGDFETLRHQSLDFFKIFFLA